MVMMIFSFMIKKIKIQIFLKILKSLFNDTTDEIQEDFCISFYHFLLDKLEFEIFEIPEEDEADISFCFSVIDLLTNFDLIHNDHKTWSLREIKKHLKNYSGLNNQEILSSLSKFRKLYSLIKMDFIFGLS